MTKSTKRTPEQEERVEVIRAINAELDAVSGVELRGNRWSRAVLSDCTDTLQNALSHLQTARALIALAGEPRVSEADLQRLARGEDVRGGGK
jgi:CTP:molybdopterin cytidylyltransferase MocA